MDFLLQLVDFVVHLSVHLDALVESYGVWVYGILFLIIFCETGLVLLPFLPGDSLLFAAGVLCASGRLDVVWLCAFLIGAATLGNAVNYWVGRLAGAEIQRRYPGLVPLRHVERAQYYFQRYGGKTVVLARFVPIVRTVAPFVAGMSQMSHLRYQAYNVLGSLLWVLLLVPAGFFFAGVPLVRNNFATVTLLIVCISVLPGLIEIVRERRRAAP